MEGQTYKYRLNNLHTRDVLELELSEHVELSDLQLIVSDLHPDHPAPEKIMIDIQPKDRELAEKVHGLVGEKPVDPDL